MKYFTLVLIILALSFICSTLSGETIAAPPSNFNEENAGTEENPYLISNLANLRWLSETSDVWGKAIYGSSNGEIYIEEKYHFLQTSDIDASKTINRNDGLGFKGIGGIRYGTMLQRSFVGVYDGNNHIIIEC